MKNFFKHNRQAILLALATLALAWGLTLFAWHAAQQAVHASHRAAFESLVRETTDRIVRRMGVYEQILRATRGFLRNSIHVSAHEYETYVENLNLNDFFPGLQGIGISQIVLPQEKDAHIAAMLREDGKSDYRIWPEGERAMYTAITRLEPLTAMNRRAIGFDMYSEPVRRQAMEAARDNARGALSGKVRLVQEGRSNVQPGFLMYLPVYAPDMPTATVEQRRAALLGWVYAPFRVHDFMRSFERGGAPVPDIRLYDGTAMTPEACMYGCDRDPVSALHLSTTIEVAGRTWLIDAHTTPAFQARLNTSTPRLILGGGLVSGLLLAAIVLALAAGRSRALALAHEMTQELRASHGRIEADRRRMRSVLQSSLDAFAAMDADGTVTDWNAAAARMFGWTAAEATGNNLAALLRFEDAGTPVDTPRFARMLGGHDERQRRLEVVAHHRDGRPLPVELSLATVSDSSGLVAHVFIRDLTQARETQQREARQRQALDEAHAALQHARRLEAIGKLTGGVAHDFNNVLQIISGNIQLMQHVAGGDPMLDARLQAAMQAVDRGARLSSQLLSFARRQPLQPRVVDLRTLLHDMRDLIQRAAGEEVQIHVAAADDLGNTTVDPAQLENVVLNLVINARDAMNGRGRLCIELANAELAPDYVAAYPDTRPGPYVMLAISDTGVGMTPDVMEQAFEPFFTTKARGGGTGLGLSMAYGFVKQSEGHIRLYSEAGHGTTVRIYLPRTHAGVERDGDRHAEPGPAPGGRETILAVEDDQSVQETVVPMLRELCYKVLTADNGDQAHALLRDGHKVDLLFTDVVMPGRVSSTDLAREAKAIDPEIGVLFTSGYTQDAIVHGGRLAPGVHLLTKPYRRDELARKIRHVLDLRGADQRTTSPAT